MLAELRRHRSARRRATEPFARLTQRERAVLRQMMEGTAAETIARSSFVSLATVRSQIRAILQKLGVGSQLAAVALAHRTRWDSIHGCSPS